MAYIFVDLTFKDYINKTEEQLQEIVLTIVLNCFSLLRPSPPPPPPPLPRHFPFELLLLPLTFFPSKTCELLSKLSE